MEPLCDVDEIALLQQRLATGDDDVLRPASGASQHIAGDVFRRELDRLDVTIVAIPVPRVLRVAEAAREIAER